MAWAAFGKLKDILQGDYPQHMKAQVFNQCVLPTLTYGSETWPITEEALQDIAICERKMERHMIGVRLADRVNNSELRRRSQVADAVRSILHLKHGWAGHVSRATNITAATGTWTPLDNKRPRGRPPTRWEDDLRKCFDVKWRRRTQNREDWN